MAGTTSLWEKNRKYLIMVISSVELTPEGFVDLAARHGLKTIAMLNEDGLVAKAAAKGAGEMGLRVVVILGCVGDESAHRAVEMG